MPRLLEIGGLSRRFGGVTAVQAFDLAADEEDVYLKGYADGHEARRGIAEWVAFYNERRPHQALADRTPMAVWREAIAGGGAVDMMDNASALPTCPQPHKQTQPLAA
jgi:putative transposase